MSHDIRDILQRITAIETRLTPVSQKKGLNPQQDKAKQLPALFKPTHITALGAKTDPEHPMKGMAVGANESKLAETMADIEEDMLSKVKKDLTQYLDRLEKRVEVDRDLKDKAVDAVEKGQAEEEEIEEDPTTENPTVEPATPPTVDPTLPEAAHPVKRFTLEDGTCLECYGDEGKGFELRRGGRSLPTRFRNLDDADIAVKLWQSRQKQQQQDQDYLDEK